MAPSVGQQAHRGENVAFIVRGALEATHGDLQQS